MRELNGLKSHSDQFQETLQIVLSELLIRSYQKRHRSHQKLVLEKLMIPFQL